MKRIIWVIFGTVLFLSGISHIDAKTVIEPTSSQGNVALNLSFEEGYVGGIDLTLKVNGAVSLSKVNWSSVIASNYTKHYSYDESTGTLRLIVTTGNQKHNLVDKKGNVGLGTLSFKSNGKTNYTISATALTIVDATYQSIVKKDLKTKSNQFVIDGNGSSGGNTGGNSNTGENNTNGDYSQSNNQVNTNGSSDKGSSSNQGSNGSNSVTQEDGLEVDSDDKTSENSDSVKDDDKNTSSIKKPDGNKKEDNSEVSKEESKKFPFRIVGFGLIAFVLLMLVIKKIKR